MISPSTAFRVFENLAGLLHRNHSIHVVFHTSAAALAIRLMAISHQYAFEYVSKRENRVKEMLVLAIPPIKRMAIPSQENIGSHHRRERIWRR